MSSSHPLDQALIDAAFAISARDWTRRFSADAYVALKTPDDPHDMYAVLKLDDVTCGVNVFHGPNVLENLRAADKARGDDLVEEALDQLGFAMCRIDRTPPEARELLRRGGREERGLAEIPWFVCKRAGRRGRSLNRDERRTLLFVLKGLLAADDAGRLKIEKIKTGARMPRITITGDPLRPEVAYDSVKIGPETATPSDDDAWDPDWDVDALPRLRRRYAVGLDKSPVGFEDDGSTLYFLFVMDVEDESLIHAGTVPGGELASLPRRILDVCEGENEPGVRGLPLELWFTAESLKRVVAGPFERVGVRCVLRSSIPALDRVFERLGSVVRETSGPGPATLPREVPAADDLAGWKAADRIVCERIALDVVHSGYRTRTHAKAFFGDRDVTEDFVTDADAGQGPSMAFSEWCFADRRTPKRPKTLLEGALENCPSEAAKLLLTARRDAKMSLYVVDAVNPGTTVELRDVLTGSRRKVHDILFSRSAVKESLVAARVHSIGGFEFLTPFSPGFPPADHDAVFDALRKAGAGAGLENLAAKPHLVGRLWGLARRIYASPRPTPRVHNMDDDPFVEHDALYEAEDPAMIRAAFVARKDFDHDPNGDVFAWNRPEKPGSKPIPSTIVARLRLIGNQILVTTNSARRHESAKAWLEGLRGVRFVSVKTTPFSFDRKSPLDDRLPDDEDRPVIAPESVASLQAAFDAYAMKWLDERIPALGGKTPREAVKTAADREKVRLLINTMPDPASSQGMTLKAPREALLRALGLAPET